MGFPNTDLLQVIYFLLPGFVAAWIFYGFTAHPRQSPFERVVQALIFTALVQPLAAGLRLLLIAAKDRGWGAYGVWTEPVGFGWSVALAIAVGISAAALSNNSLPHDWFPGWVTKRTSSPSEWYSALARYPRFVCLRLKDGRTLWGWPEEWPDAAESGHFLIKYPCWLLNDGRRVELPLAEALLLPAEVVEMIEFEVAQEALTDAVKAGNEAARRELLELRQTADVPCPSAEESEDAVIDDRPAANSPDVEAPPTAAAQSSDDAQRQQESSAAGSDGGSGTPGGAAPAAEGDKVAASKGERFGEPPSA